MILRKEPFLVAALLLGIFVGPVALANYLLASGPAAPQLQLAAVTDGIAPGLEEGQPSGEGASALVAGVLYTSGKATINWNGVSLPIENGSYAYVGGEAITTEPESMAILQLAGGDLIYLCPESTLTVERTPDGRYAMHLAQGTSRFVISSGTPFEIHANETVLKPGEGSDPDRAYVGEIKAHQDSGCLVCNLQNSVQVEAVDLDAVAVAGQFIDVRPAVAEPGSETVPEAATAPLELDASQIPPDLFGAIQASFAAAGGAGGSTEYLCRCQDLKRYADGVGVQVAEAEPSPDAQPPAPAPEVAPPVAPPDAPALALAEPGVPTLDPNVLPPPAAGLPVSTLSVAPPSVPAGGTGGRTRGQ